MPKVGKENQQRGRVAVEIIWVYLGYVKFPILISLF